MNGGPSREAASRGTRLRRRGVTLLELMVVMFLLSIVLGFGLGMFATVDPGQRAAVGQVQNLLRKAGNSAVTRAATARVRIEPAGSRFSAEVLRTIGTWHFEDEGLVRGAFGLDGSLEEGGEIVADGWVGRGLSFRGGARRARVSIAVQERPEWDFERGFVVEVALRREDDAGARVLSVGETFQLEVGGAGEFTTSFLAKRLDSTGRPLPGERVTLRAPRGMLERDRWHHLRIGYDMTTFWAELDAVRVVEVAAEVPVFEIEGNFILSGGDAPFPGTIDAVVVSVVDAQESLELPGGVLFAPDAPAEIVFGPGGGLARAVHPEPLQIGLDFSGGYRRTVRVELYGTVQ